jgi:hypothetical protein
VIIVVTPEPFVSVSATDVDRLGSVLVRADTEDGRHLVLGDPEGSHRISFLGRALEDGGAFLIPFDRDFNARLHAVQHFQRKLSGQRSGLPLRSVRLSPPQRMRLALQVRALDAIEENATRREIAAVLIDPDARTIPAIEWKNSALRKQVIRLIAAAQLHMNGGYLALLRADSGRAKRFGRPTIGS